MKNVVGFKAPKGMWRVLILCLLTALPIPCFSGVQAEIIVAPIVHYICFDKYWRENTSYRNGATVFAYTSPTDTGNGNDWNVWVEGLEDDRSIPENATFFHIRNDGGVWGVVEVKVLNGQLLKRQAEYESLRGKVFSGKVGKVSIEIPRDCSIEKHETPSAQKAVVLDALRKTIAEELSQLNKNADAHYPEETRVVIANFELDYPETFVLVPETGEVYLVRLRDSGNNIATYLKQGSFPVGLIDKNDDWLNSLRKKIAVNGTSIVVRVSLNTN